MDPLRKGSRVGAAGRGFPFPSASFPFPFPPPHGLLLTPRRPEPEDTLGDGDRGPGRGAGRRSESAPSAPRSLHAGKKGGGGRVRMWRGGREPARRRAAAAARCPGGGRAVGRRTKAGPGSRGPAVADELCAQGACEWRAQASAAERILRTGGQLMADPGPPWRGTGRAASGELRAASTWRCVGPAATRAPYTWGAARRRRGRGRRRRRPGPAREGVGQVCGKFEAGRDTPGPGWRPWGDGVWRCARPGGSLIGAKLPWTAEELGRFPTSLECRFENLGENLLLKRRSMEEV